MRLISCSGMPRAPCGRSTCDHLGREQVICCWEVDGVLVDPGPQSCEETLLEALGGERAAGAAAHPHPLRPRGRRGGARAPLAGPAGLRPRARRAAPGRPRAARGQRRAAVRRRGGAARACGARSCRCPEAQPARAERRRDGARGASGRVHARPRLAPRLLPARADRLGVRRRHGRRAHPAARLHARPDAAARHRRRGVGALARHDRRLGAGGARRSRTSAASTTRRPSSSACASALHGQAELAARARPGRLRWPALRERVARRGRPRTATRSSRPPRPTSSTWACDRWRREACEAA